MFIKSIDNASIYYEKSGDGPPIILIHGLGGDHSIWKTFGWVEELNKCFTVISYDLRGCGKSDSSVNKDFYSIDLHLSDIKAIIDFEKVISPILFGWSLGGTIATHYIKKYSVDKAIIGGTYFGLIFSKELIDKGINGTSDDILIERLKAFYEWPIVYPNDIECPYLIYSGTNDGNVVVRIKEQQKDIIENKGKVFVFDKLDHIGLISQKEIVKHEILKFIE